MTVLRQLLRNRKTTRTVNTPPRSSVVCTSSTASRINNDMSLTTWIVVWPGSSRFSLGSSALTASATSTVLPPDCFRISSARARRPSIKASVRCSS